VAHSLSIERLDRKFGFADHPEIGCSFIFQFYQGGVNYVVQPDLIIWPFLIVPSGDWMPFVAIHEPNLYLIKYPVDLDVDPIDRTKGKHKIIVCILRLSKFEEALIARTSYHSCTVNHPLDPLPNSPVGLDPLDYDVILLERAAIQSTTKVRPVCDDPKPPRVSVEALALSLPKRAWRTVAWREVSLRSHFEALSPRF
jgi:hypothetical protein